MAGKNHAYDVSVTWTGNWGTGTSSYRAYGREHDVTSDTAAIIAGSADPSFRGDPARWNPEQLQVAALSQCHMLWYLNLAASAGVIVVGYRDDACGVMVENADGSGQFAHVTLRPQVAVSAESDIDLAVRLHADVPAKCCIARSVNFPVHHEPDVVRVETQTGQGEQE